MANYLLVFFLSHFLKHEEKNTLKSVIGIAQKEIAVILGITRSHCAMCAAGKRSLPLQAKQELTRIQQYINEKKVYRSRTAKLYEK